MGSNLVLEFFPLRFSNGALKNNVRYSFRGSIASSTNIGCGRRVCFLKGACEVLRKTTTHHPRFTRFRWNNLAESLRFPLGED